jgi:hypothetical protein
MAQDRFGYGTEEKSRERDYPNKPDWYKGDLSSRPPSGKVQSLQNVIDVNYYVDDIKIEPPKASIVDGRLHVELGAPPADSEDAYIEWLRGAEMMDRSGWDDTSVLFREAGLSEKQSDIVYTIEGKPISEHKGLFGTNFLKRPGTDFIGGLPRRA